VFYRKIEDARKGNIIEASGKENGTLAMEVPFLMRPS